MASFFKIRRLGGKGTVFIEFALVGTIFLSLFMLILYLGFWAILYSSLEGAVRDVGRLCSASMGIAGSNDTQCRSSAGIRALLTPRLPDLFEISDIKVSSFQFENLAAARNHVPTEQLIRNNGREIFATGDQRITTYEISYDSPKHNFNVPFLGSLGPIRAYTVLIREPS